MVNKLFLTIIVSIILTAIIISLVNVGMSLFLPSPNWDDYCGAMRPVYIDEANMTSEICTANGGEWITKDIKCFTTPCPQGYCDYYSKCQKEYDNALKPYNQIRYYIFAGIGFILLLIGLFAIENMIQLTGLATGGILVLQGIVMNFQNKLIVFISLILILIIFGLIAYRIIRSKK
ncbi:MAG: hypothetical protein ACP5OG_05170 [Candidatus Nanoarchaeia archaeon]